MTTEDHRLLMEALMFFSSDDSDDADVSSSTGEPSTTTSTSFDTAKTNSGSTKLGSPPPQELAVGGFDKALKSQITRRKRSTPTSTTKQLARRKRVKKCTYAARREEVARLRASTYQLEAQLEHLQKRVGSRDLSRQRAQYEQELLAQSQAENQRLRALLSAGESRIQQARAQNLGGGYAEPQCVV